MYTSNVECFELLEDFGLTICVSVFPGNTYNYSPFNASVQSQFYNNLYGPGNCVDQILDCKARGIDEICSSAVRHPLLYCHEMS